MRVTTLTALAAALAFTLAGTATAQPAPPDAPDQPQREQQQQRRAEAQRRIETIRIARLTEELDLDPETAVHLIPLLKRNDELRRKRLEQRRALAKAAREELDALEPDDARLEELIEQFWDQEEDFLKARRDVFDEMADVLTPTQQVRLIEFGPRFDQEIRDLMREARELRRQRRERPPGPDDRPNGGDWWRDDQPPEPPAEPDTP